LRKIKEKMLYRRDRAPVFGLMACPSIQAVKPKKNWRARESLCRAVAYMRALPVGGIEFREGCFSSEVLRQAKTTVMMMLFDATSTSEDWIDT
jgi:hypothetical protein